MTVIEKIDFQITLTSAKMYFDSNIFPESGSGYTDTETQRSKDSCTVSATAQIGQHKLRVSLHIAHTMKITASVIPLSLSQTEAERFSDCLSLINRAMPDGIVVSMHDRQPEFSEVIWNKKDFCDEEWLKPHIEALISMTVACLNALSAVLKGEAELPSGDVISASCLAIMGNFCPDNHDSLSEKSDRKSGDDKKAADTAAAVPGQTGEDDISGLIEMIREPEADDDTDDDTDELRQDKKDAAPQAHDTIQIPKADQVKHQYEWLDSTDFSNHEKYILTYFKKHISKG